MKVKMYMSGIAIIQLAVIALFVLALILPVRIEGMYTDSGAMISEGGDLATQTHDKILVEIYDIYTSWIMALGAIILVITVCMQLSLRAVMRKKEKG
jgi:hypothetical protein